MQEGSCDRGLFAMAFITSISIGKDPAVLSYKQNAMRKHILKSIEDGMMTAFPQVDILRHLSGRIFWCTVFVNISMMVPK